MYTCNRLHKSPTSNFRIKEHRQTIHAADCKTPCCHSIQPHIAGGTCLCSCLKHHNGENRQIPCALSSTYAHIHNRWNNLGQLCQVLSQQPQQQSAGASRTKGLQDVTPLLMARKCVPTISSSSQSRQQPKRAAARARSSQSGQQPKHAAAKAGSSQSRQQPPGHACVQLSDTQAALSQREPGDCRHESPPHRCCQLRPAAAASGRGAAAAAAPCPLPPSPACMPRARSSKTRSG